VLEEGLDRTIRWYREFLGEDATLNSTTRKNEHREDPLVKGASQP